MDLRQSNPQAGAQPPARSIAGMPSVLVVMGVSGSGKSTVGTQLALALHWDFEDGDWFHPARNIDKMHAGIPLTDEDRAPWLIAIADFIDQALLAGRMSSSLARRSSAAIAPSLSTTVRTCGWSISRAISN